MVGGHGGGVAGLLVQLQLMQGILLGLPVRCDGLPFRGVLVCDAGRLEGALQICPCRIKGRLVGGHGGGIAGLLILPQLLHGALYGLPVCYDGLAILNRHLCVSRRDYQAQSKACHERCCVF